MTSVVIMAGGRGERFWPRSRNGFPKQFIPVLDHEKSMIEETLDRALQLTEKRNVFISLRQDLVEACQTALPDFPQDQYIIEPMGRDTAAALGLAAVFCDRKRPGSVVVNLPADHVVSPDDVFATELKNAVLVAGRTDCLLTLGIKPSRPDTSYGYIEVGELIHSQSGTEAFEVRRFTEKPDSVKAAEFLRTGRFLWNSGMFVWKSSVFLTEVDKFLPAHYAGLLEIQEMMDSPEWVERAAPVFGNFQKISVDFGIMEKAKNVLCVKATFQWDDVGAWSALERITAKDADGNIVRGLAAGTGNRNSTILNYSPGRVVATAGLEDVIVVNTKDAVLVLDKKSESDMKKLLQLMQSDPSMKDFL